MESKEDNGPYNIFTETEMIIEFYDIDSMQVVYHGNYMKYFEIGRRTLLEKIGYYYHEMIKTEFLFPVIEISVKYLSSLRFLDKVKIKSVLMEYENRIKIKYEIRNVKTNTLTTKAVSTQMVFNMKTGETCFVCPDILMEKVEALIRENKQ